MDEPIDNDDLLRFVDGALDDAGRVRVLMGMACRPTAIERVEAYLEQNARLRDLRRHLPMADSISFARPLQDALAVRLTAAAGLRRRCGQALAAALALTLVSGVIGLGYNTMRVEHTGEAASSAPTQSLAATPTLFQLGVNGSSEAPAIEGATTVATHDDDAAFDWLEAHLSDFSLSAPALDRIGLSLVGSETMQAGGMPVIRIGYRDAAGSAVVLYAGVTGTDAALAFRPVEEGQLSMQWRHGPMIFALVAPTNSPQLSNVVDLVGRAVARIAVPEGAEAVQTPEGQSVADVVQAIAIPLARPERSSGPSPSPNPSIEASDPVVDPATLADPSHDNEPKPL